MSMDSGFNIEKSNPRILGNNNSTLKGGLRRESVDPKLHSLFDKADKDKNGILDDAELKNSRAEIDTNNDGSIDIKESKKYIKDNNLTYTNDKGKQKELSNEELQQFFDNVAQNADKANIKAVLKGDVDGKAAVTIIKNDGSREIIFDDKNEPTRFVSEDLQTGETKTQFVKDGKILSEETNAQNGDKTTTEFSDDGKPLKSTIVKSENGEILVTNYTDGVKKSKDVIIGTTSKHYSIDQNGNEILENEVQDLGNGLKKTSSHSYDGNKETVTINNPDGSQTVQTKIDGKLSQTSEIKAGETITIKYNDNGSKVEIKEKNNVTTTTLLNADEHRTQQTQIVKDNAYTVQYDGKGNTLMVVRAGDSLEKIADYMTKNSGQQVTVADLKKLNPKITNDNIQAGQMITVPGEYDAASGIVLSRGTQKEQKVKGDAAETKLNSIVVQLNETEEINITKGQYKNYNEYAKDLLQAEGISTRNEQLINKTAKKIAQMNENKPISELSVIKSPISESRKQLKSNNAEVSQGKEKRQEIQKNHKSGRNIASEIYNSIKGLGTDINRLDFAIGKITTQNAAYSVLAYREFSDDKEGVASAIINEFGLPSQVQKQDIKIIFNKLEARAKELNIDTSDLNSQFYNKNTNDSGTLGNLDKNKLDNILETMATRIAQKESLSSKDIKEINSATTEEKHQITIHNLDRYNEIAHASLNAQWKNDGWAGKVANQCGYLTKHFGNGIENTQEAVWKDIAAYEKDIDKLRKAEKEGKFEQAFKEIYGVNYYPVLVKAYDNIKTQWAKVDAAHANMKLFENDNKKLLEYKEGEKVSSGMFANVSDKIKTEMTRLSKEMKLDNFNPYIYGFTPANIQKAFVDYIGNDVLKQKYGKDISWSKATNEQKYAVLSDVAKKYDDALKQDFNEKSQGKTYLECKTQAHKAYVATYGNKNDVAARVEDYNHSQLVGAGVIKTTAKISIALFGAATGGAGYGVGAFATFAGGMAVDATDVLTSESRELDSETVQNILMENGLNTAMYLSGGSLGEALKDASRFAKITGHTLGHTAIGSGVEYIQKGEITIEGTLVRATYSAVGALVKLEVMPAIKNTGSKFADKLKDSGHTNMSKVTQTTVNAATSKFSSKVLLKNLKGMSRDNIDNGIIDSEDAI